MLLELLPLISDCHSICHEAIAFLKRHVFLDVSLRRHNFESCKELVAVYFLVLNLFSHLMLVVDMADSFVLVCHYLLGVLLLLRLRVCGLSVHRQVSSWVIFNLGNV
jgi:hypothetical protein